MPDPKAIQDALGRVTDQASFLRELLGGVLGWPVERGVEKVEDISYGWSAEELRASGLDEKLVGGQVYQLQPLTGEQPWGVFLLEFKHPDAFTKGRGITSPLRKVLRGLVPSRRKEAGLASWQREHLLFICTHKYKHFRFAYFRAPREEGRSAPLASFGWSVDDTHVRTLCEFNLPHLAWPDDASTDAWTRAWAQAFDVAKVTKKFFEEYREVFEATENAVLGVPEGEERRLYTQRLFNRLMFLYFIQKKGWLALDGDKRYLRALFEASRREGREDFLNGRLNDLFFRGLRLRPEDVSEKERESLKTRIGKAPFLNGGLFELCEYDDRGTAAIPDEVFDRILSLFESYNFTITESTPLDIEVAVDPEMLGKVFEELVTGRHESGSYYTPRPIVSFMCREALKGYLSRFVEDGKAVLRFVDLDDPAGLPDPEKVLQALKEVMVCDPACGSGAYLLGMMQELLRLRQALFERKDIDRTTAYRRKLEIIHNNLYGVDLDPFAVNIAMLRLWLSLSVEAEEPVPLPNLDFKIEVGDSLTAPSPEFIDDLYRRKLIDHAIHLAGLKREYLSARRKKDKDALRQAITQDERDLSESIASSKLREDAFDWRIRFAEAFAPRGGMEATLDGHFGFVKDLKPQRLLTERIGKDPGGFDIVLANPPYLRAEGVKQRFGDAYKKLLAKLYPEACSGTSDLYVAFYARAHQLIRSDGVACFISSNKWLRAAYGEKLRRHLLDKQAFRLVVDFGELPVFETAATFPAVFLWQKTPRESSPTAWAAVKDLDECYAEGVREHVFRIAETVPASRFGEGKPRLATAKAADMLAKMEKAGVPLGEYVKKRIYYGIKTGFNEAFVIDGARRAELIAEDPRSAEIIKPLAVGDDVRRWRIEERDRWLIVTPIGVEIGRYPAIFDHLKQWERQLKKRQDQGNHWWELRACDYYSEFEKPKIMYPEIAMEPRFAFDSKGTYPIKTIFSIPVDDLYLLGVLNSSTAWAYLKNLCSVLGDAEERGRLTLQGIYLEKLPIPSASPADREAIAALARKCLDAKGVGCEEWEKEIDSLVAGLYGLAADEIGTVEGIS